MSKVVDLGEWKHANPMAVYRAIGKRRDENTLRIEAAMRLLDPTDPDYVRRFVALMTELRAT